MDQYNWIKELGHSIVEPAPSLFTFNLPGDDITRLMGITVPDVMVKIQGTNLHHRGSLLITHWGMSGPAILKLSSFGAVDLAQKKYEFTYTVNWLPEYNETSLREELQRFRFELASQKMTNRNPFKLASRLWEFLLAKAGLGQDIRWSDLPAKDQNKLAKLLCSQEFHAKGKTTFKEEFVTAGGVDTSQINPESMESRQCRGLYFAGEIMNVDGVTGGFNFQNAWTSGWLAAVNMKCD
jgi:predicted Rossmann fold flavoprotein